MLNMKVDYADTHFALVAAVCRSARERRCVASRLPVASLAVGGFLVRRVIAFIRVPVRCGAPDCMRAAAKVTIQSTSAPSQCRPFPKAADRLHSAKYLFDQFAFPWTDRLAIMTVLSEH